MSNPPLLDGLDVKRLNTQIALVDFDKAKGQIIQRAACDIGAVYLNNPDRPTAAVRGVIMRQRERLAINMLNPGAAIYTARAEWTLEIIRTPRPSCIDKWTWRNQLRDMYPGTKATINGVDIYRKNLAHQASRYLIAGEWHNVSEAIAAIEAGKQEAA